MRFVLLRSKQTSRRICRKHFVGWHVAKSRCPGQSARHVSLSLNQAIVVQISGGSVNESIVVWADTQAAIRAEVVWLAFALIMIATKAMSACTQERKSEVSQSESSQTVVIVQVHNHNRAPGP